MPCYMMGMEGDGRLPEPRNAQMTLSKTESRQSMFAMLAALPLTAALLAFTLSLTEFVV